MAMAQSDFPREILFNFIQSLYNEFMAKYQDRLEQLQTYSLNDEYAPIMKEKMNHYNKNKNSMKGDELLEKLENSVKEMKVNLIKTGGVSLNRIASTTRR